MRHITKGRGTYTQYLVRWVGKTQSEDKWILSLQEHKKTDEKLCKALAMNSSCFRL